MPDAPRFVLGPTLPAKKESTKESARIYDGPVTIYYVECKSCAAKIELDRKPRRGDTATYWSISWTESISCTCGRTNSYTYKDIRQQETYGQA